MESLERDEEGKKIVKENILKITGGFPLDVRLQNGRRYDIGLRLDIYAHEEKDNQDGTVTNVFKANSNLPAVLQNEDGKKIETKQKSSQGQRNRMAIENLWESDDALQEHWSKEGFYDWYNGNIRGNMIALLKFFIKETGEKI